jgi:hypothetical protein
MTVWEQRIKREVEEALKKLPVEKMAEVLDFVLFLRKRYGEVEPEEPADYDSTTPSLRSMPASHMDDLTGLVEWGGDALADSEHIYDDSL